MLSSPEVREIKKGFLKTGNPFYEPTEMTERSSKVEYNSTPGKRTATADALTRESRSRQLKKGFPENRKPFL